MNTLQDRYVLVLDVLNGVEDANHILSDLLDESGHRALAEWARSGQKRAPQRLDFALATLPYTMTLSLACDFLSTSLKFYARTEFLIEAIDSIRDWTESPAHSDLLERGCSRMANVIPWQFGIKDIDRTAQSLHLAASCAGIALDCGRHGDDARYRGHAAEVSHAARRVTKSARVIFRDGRMPYSWTGHPRRPRSRRRLDGN